ncbi:MAG: MFS transporter [Paludibacter sp.]|nr:MFS transporter [Paludibacter sp.]
MKKYSSYQVNPMYGFLAVLCIASALGNQGWQTLFNNFAVEKAGADSVQVGAIQSFREIPGFLTFFAVYILLLIAEHRFAVYSILLLGIGVMITGLFPTFEGLIITGMIMSVGFHFFETANQSLTLQYFSPERVPIVLAKFRSYTALTNIVAGVFIWIMAGFLSYQWMFFVIGALVFLAGLYSLRKNPVDELLPPQHKKLILKRKYWLFYVLNFLSGSRRQIFMVFAIFILVQKYHFSITYITILFVINNIITFVLSPYIGKAINRYGERTMLTVEYVFLIFVFLGYGLIENEMIVTGLYIVDNLFFSFAISINSFFRKQAEPADIAPSMAVGFTINHLTAVFLPVLGGILWVYNWRIPFLGGAFLAFLSLIFARLVPSKKDLANISAVK